MVLSAVSLRDATPAERSGWDELVRRFPNHRAPHTQAWIEALAASGCGRPLYLVFERDGEICGCLPGLVTSVAGWRLFGSPLPGWQTVSLGPAFDPGRLTTAEMIDVLVPYLEQRHRIDHIEIMTGALDGDAMGAAGFHGEPVFTYQAPLFPGDEERGFRTLKDSARRNVRRAERLGLEVRFETDERFVDEHYDQLREVYQAGGYAVPFSVHRIRECFRRMHAAGSLLATSVYLPGGRVSIATGMFFIEGRELLLWMWAHRHHYRWYRPTELMTWTAMRRAMDAGCERFDLMGRGEFKAKFGAEPDETKVRWVRSRRRWLTHARRLAQAGYRWQQAVRGRIPRLARRVWSALTPNRSTGARPACVLGDVDLVRALGLAGIPSVVVAPPGAPARFSRHTRAAIPWADAAEHGEELVERLLRYAESQPEPPVLFYQDDRSLLLVSRHRERLRRLFRFVLPEPELVEQLVDKGQFQALATRLELPVPPARVFHPAAEPLPSDIGLAFPLILKPITRLPEHWEPVAGAGKATRLDALDDLRTLWPRLATANLGVLAQQLVPGAETRVESYHVYVNEAGETVGEFTGRKIRTLPVTYGDSTAVEITDTADVRALGRELVRRLGLRGVAKLDFKRGNDGLLYLLEVNPRFNLWHHPGAAAGVNLPALVYGDLVGRPRPDVPRAQAGVRWCKPWKDAPAARAVGLSLTAWLPWALACEVKGGIAWGDPLPLVGAVLWRWMAATLRTPRLAGDAGRLPPGTIRRLTT